MADTTQAPGSPPTAGSHDEAAASPTQLLLRTLMGAWVSQTLGTLSRLRVFDALAAGPGDAAAVAQALGLDADALQRLLRASAAVGVLRLTAPGRYALTATGQLLRSDVPGSLRALFDAETAPGRWLPWGRLDDCLRTGRSAVPAALGGDIGSYYGRHPVEAQAYSQAMNGMSGLALQAIDAVWDLPPATCVVDVGGAHGSFLTHVLHRRPAARGVLFDLPHVIATAGPALAAAGFAGRVEPVAGDFMRAVPAGGDVYLLKHVLHEWNDAQAHTILRNVRQAMTPAATVVTVEMLIPEDGAPSPALLMDLDMLVTSSGRERTAGEMKALFAAAGLAITRVVATPSPFFVLEARAG